MRSTSPPVLLAGKRLDLYVFLAAAAVIAAFWLFVPGEWTVEANPLRDYQSFFAPVAQNLAAGKGLVTDDGQVATTYPPGYPIMLAALLRLADWTGVRYETWLALFTLASVALAGVALFRIGARILGVGGGLITAVLWITYPSALWLSKQPTSDTAFLPFFFFAMLLFVALLQIGEDGVARPASVGILLGIAVLIRPIALLIAPLLAICLWFKRRKKPTRALLLSAALLLGYVVTILPWELWVWQRTGGWILVSTNGPASISDGLTAGVVVGGYRRPIEIPAGVRRVMEPAHVLRSQGRLKTMSEVVEFVLQAVQNQPADFAELLWWKARRAWYGTDSQRGEEIWIAWVHAVYLALMLAGAVLLWRGGGEGRCWLLVSIPLVLYYWFMTVVALSIVRYMLPAVGLMFVWLAALLEHVWKRWRGARVPVH